MILDAHTKRPSDKTSQGQIVPREKMSQGTKRPKGTNEAHYLNCVNNYLIQYGQDKGMAYSNLPIIRKTPIHKLS